MANLLSLLIVAINPIAPMEARYPAATEVYHHVFDTASDRNYDLWPDGWLRRAGVGFPQYVGIELVAARSPNETAGLRITLDGGAAAMTSPVIDVSPFHGYVLEGRVKTEGLMHDEVFLSLTFLDKNGERVSDEHYTSVRLTRTGSWRKVRLGPIEPQDPSVRSVMIGLNVLPGEQEDLQGEVWFDEVWLARLPRISMTANRPDQIYTSTNDIRVTCKTSGFSQKDVPVRFTLADTLSRAISEYEAVIHASEIMDFGRAMDGKSEGVIALVGSVQWKPPITDPGFYRVVATIDGVEGILYRRELQVAVIDSHRREAGGHFGWTLPNGHPTADLDHLGQLLGQAGVHWVKFPMWCDTSIGEQQVREFARFRDRMSGYGIELVGLLSQPPESIRSALETGDTMSAAEILSHDSNLWLPSIEATLLKTAMQVRYWQLGNDDDTSFVRDTGLNDGLTEMRKLLDEIGYDVGLGIPWQWLEAAPRDVTAWRFLNFSADPPLTHRELAAYLDRTKLDEGVRRWVNIAPLPSDHYDCATRIEDLVRRMMEAKIHGADAIYATDPFDARTGLMNPDGTPGELFLPWRTTANCLGSARYIGSLQLPEGSENHVFLRGSDAVMVVWNDRPVEEVLFLGADARRITPWGEISTPPRQEHQQILSVGEMPTFLTGVDPYIAQWRRTFEIVEDRIPGKANEKYRNAFRMTNSFHRGVSGSVRLVASDGLILAPEETTFRLDEGESLEQEFDISLPFDAVNGVHTLRIDITVETDPVRRFSVYRRIIVGRDDVFATFETRLDREGRLIVEQTLHNRSERNVSFSCQLAIPGRARQRREVFGLGYGSDVQTYVVEDGRELIGDKLRVRAREVDGPADLNYELTARP